MGEFLGYPVVYCCFYLFIYLFILLGMYDEEAIIILEMDTRNFQLLIVLLKYKVRVFGSSFSFGYGEGR